MSYILEALKKSSEERARVVSVAPKTEPDLANAHRPTRISPAWLIAAIGLCALMVAAVTWTGKDHPETGPDRSPDRSPTATAPARLDEPAAAPAIAVAASPKELPPKAPDAVLPAKAIAADVPPAPKKRVAKIPPPPPDTPTVPAAQPVPHSRSEMPPELLKQVLAIPISAHIYSAKPVERMIIIDGRAVREGDSLASGILVEQITPTGISVSYQGYRASKPVN